MNDETLWSQLVSKLKEVAHVATIIKFDDIPAFVDAAINTNSLDDRQLLLERALVLMAKLGAKESPDQLKKLGHSIQELVIDLLYKDLPHPPIDYSAGLDKGSYVPQQPAGPAPPTLDGTGHAFRSVDGTNYNPLIPGLGRARGPYARSVPALNRNPPSYLPDAALVFDSLLARDEFVEHPGGVSSLFFSFADVIIHTLFDTDHKDGNINNTSSYLDLSVLYGTTKEGMDEVRTLDGSGKMWNDVWADRRLLLMPPSVCAIMVIFNRNHNYIAEKILRINENSQYKQNLETLSSEERTIQDDDIFNRARLVNCGFFMQVILADYVAAILGLARDGSDWRLDPLMDIRRPNHEVSPRGEGNVVSLEFNLLYRWHATLSKEDTQWTEDLFKQKFDQTYPGEDINKMTVNQFKGLARDSFMGIPGVKQWTFKGLQRNTDGKFNDADIAKILQDATQARAGAYKARGIPTALRVIEIMGIEQSRKWGACSLNEFRKFIGLKPYETFEEWNENKDVASAAQALYKHIDNLELHVGMQAEQAKEPGPGAGLCPGYTISRAILADAVALTRGDRFLTSDLTPMNLTTWGYNDCQRDTSDGAYGGMLTRLLFRHLPAQYPSGSSYAHFPFLTPDYMEKVMKDRPEEYSKYTWTRPLPAKKLDVIKDYSAVKHVLDHPHTFVSSYRERLSEIVQSRLPTREVVARVLQDRNNLSDIADTIEVLTKEAVQKRSYDIGTGSAKYVDIVEDVLHAVPVRWVYESVAGLPSEGELSTEREYFSKFGDVFRYVTLSPAEPGSAWSLRERSRDSYAHFVRHVERHLDHLGSWIASITDKVNATNDKSHTFLRKLKDAASGTALADNHDELATALFCEVAPTVTAFSITMAVCLDYYLAPEMIVARNSIVRLYKSRKDETIWKNYMLPALASSPPVSSKQYLASQKAQFSGESVDLGDLVVLDIIAANNERGDDEVLHALDSVGMTTVEFLKHVGSRMLGALLALPDLEPASSSDQVLSARFINVNHLGVEEVVYQDRKGNVVPWPTEAILKYEPPAKINGRIRV